jgi:multiple sugar transport system permease protein
VTLPLMWPTIVVTFVFRLVLAFKVFDEVYLLTGGGPGTATEVVSFTIYQRFFTEDRAGYGAAMAVAVIFLIFLMLAAAAAARRRVQA